MSGATFGLVVKNAGGIAFDGSGAVAVTIPGLTSITSSSVRVSYNTTGAALNQTLVLGSISALIDVATGTVGSPFTLVSALGFNATFTNFVTISGDFGFKKNASGDLEVAVNGATALLTTAAASLGVTSANLGLLIKSGGGLALSASGTPQLTLPTTFVSVSASSVSVDYNTTGAAVNQTLSVGAVSKVLSIPSGSSGTPFSSLTLTNFSAGITDFVTLSGTFGVQKTAGDELIVAATSAAAQLEVGSLVKVGVTAATLGLIIKPTQKFALQASGGAAVLSLGGGFAGATAASVAVAYNNTGANVNTTAQVTASGSTVSAPIVVNDGVTAVIVTSLSATVNDYISLSGTFGIRRDSVTGVLVVAGTNVGAQLDLGTAVKVGLSGATVGLIIKANEKMAFEASGGSVVVSLGSGFASVSATSVGVAYNNTGAAVSTTASVTVGGATVNASINVADGVTAVTVVGLNATISEFVKLSGDFGIRKNSATNVLEVAGNSVSAQLEVDSLIKVGVTGAKIGLIITATEKIAIQTTGGALSLNLGSGFATATATTVAVRFNNTGANVNQTLSVTVGGTTISAPINVNDGTTSVVVTGLDAQIGGFVTLSGDMGFKKDVTGRLIAAGNNVSATLNVGSVVKAGVTGATVGLIITSTNKIALQATGGTSSLVLGSGFASATATSIGVSYNNTGADVATTITSASAGISAPINVLDGVTSVTVTGLSATVLDFVTISGDFGFEKTTGGDLEVVGNSVSAKLVLAGDVIQVGVTGAKLALIVTQTEKIALQTSNGSLAINLGSGFATATATTVAVRFNNTTANVNQTLSVTVGGTTISAPLNVNDGTTSVVVTGLDAQIGGFVTLSGDMGFKKDVTGRLIAAGNNVSATLNVGSVIKAGVTGATVGLIITSTNKIALQATGGTSSLVLGSGFASATATSIGVSYNNTGADVATTITSASAGISAPINVLNGVTSVTVTGLSATVLDFVTISGDFGFEKTVGGDLEVVGNSVSAKLVLAGDVIQVGVTGAKLALIVTQTEKIALQTSNGSLAINLGSGFATATATTVAVRFNNTTANVNQTLSVTVGGTTISAPINVNDGTTSVVVTGLEAQIGGFVTLSGDMGFKKDVTGRLIAAGNNVSATLNVGSIIKAGVTGATVGLIITSTNKIALQATGGTSSLVLGSGFASATATSIGVSYNNTGADVATTITSASAGISAPINVLDGVTSVTVTGLSATVLDFVTISGDFGFEKTVGGDLEVVGNSVSAKLVLAGDVIQVGVTGAKLALIVTQTEKIALQTSNGSLAINLGSGFATATATTVAVRFNNTTANVNQTLSVTVGGTTISAPINVNDGTTSVVVTGLEAQIGGFVTLSGDMGFKKDVTGRLIAAGNNVSATLNVGSIIKAGVTGATVGLIITSTNKIALQATGGTSSLVLGSGFASATATSIGVSYNNTGADVATTITSASAGISAPINVLDGVTSVTVTGLSATVLDFVTISGDFGFEKTVGGDLEVVGNSVSAKLVLAGDVIQVGVTGAKLALIVTQTEKIALQTSNGSLAINLGSGFATATATTVAVRFNNTTANVNQTLSVTVGGTTISAPLNVNDGTTSVVVTGLEAQIGGFVTLSGDMGFKKDVTGRLIAAGNNVSATLNVGSIIKAGVTGATVGLIITSTNKIALQATGGTSSLVLGSGFASATATSIGVSYNNTGADVATTITSASAGISAPINVLDGVTSVTVTGLSATVLDFVTISGDFGFEKTVGGDLEVVGNSVSAKLVLAGDVIQVGVTGAKLALIVTQTEKIALQTSNGSLALNLGSGFATATATTVAVRFNNTTANVNQTLSVTVGGTTISAPINVNDGTTSVVVTGLEAQIGGFVTLSGDMGFKKDVTGRLIAAGNNVSATLNVGSIIKAGVTGATVGLIITSTNKIALQATGGTSSLVLGSGFASATATSIGVSYNNTGADVATTITSASAGISAPINVLDGVTSVTVTGLSATVLDFVTISGDFGFEKTVGGDLEVVGNSVSAKLVLAGDVIQVGVTGAKLALIVTQTEKIALQTSNGSLAINLGSGFATATATTVAVRFNNTTANVNQTLSVTVGGTTISAPLNVNDGTTSVVVTGLEAQIGGFVTLSGDMGFKKDVTGRLIAAGNNVSATLNVGSIIKAGVTGATVGLIITSTNKIALQATGGTSSLVLGSGFASATATSIGVSYNNTGADVATTITSASAGISAPINVLDGVTSVTVTGLSATVLDFVTISGDFGFEKTVGGDLEVVGNSVSAKLVLAGDVIQVGVTGAKLALIVTQTEKIALQTSNGSLALNLGSGFATATATTVAVRFNNTTANVNQTLSVTVGGTTISAPINVNDGTTSVVVTGLEAQIGGFVTLSGDMGFKKDVTGRLIAAGNNVSATLNVGSIIKAGVTGATVGLIITSTNKIALQATGGTSSLVLGSGFASATATSIGVSYNNTGEDVATTITSASAGISAPINVLDGVTTVTVLGLNAQVLNFVTITGDFGFRKNANGDLEVAGDNITARLEVGSALKVGVTGAKLGLIVKPAQTLALQASGGSASIILGSGFASATATSVAVAFNNTGANVATTIDVTVGGTAVSAPISVNNGVTAVLATGLVAEVLNFVAISGDFGFEKNAGGDLEVAANNASARLEIGGAIRAGVTGATVGLIVKSNQTLALQATGGTASLVLGSGFASATATSVGVSFNNTGANVNGSAIVSIAGTTITAPIVVTNGVTSVTVTGLNAQVLDFVAITGNFGFEKTAGGDLEVAGTNISARLEVGTAVKAGVTGATLGLIVKPDQKLALQATGGTASLILGSGFASATATSVGVAFNNTGGDLNITASVTTGGTTISAPINVLNNVAAVAVTGLNAQILNFVTITGDFGIKKDSNGDLIVAATGVSARLEVGTAIKAGVTGATLGLIVKQNQTLALQATGSASIVLGSGFASATATSVSVAYNNTGALVNTTAAVVIGGVSVTGSDQRGRRSHCGGGDWV